MQHKHRTLVASASALVVTAMFIAMQAILPADASALSLLGAVTGGTQVVMLRGPNVRADIEPNIETYVFCEGSGSIPVRIGDARVTIRDNSENDFLRYIISRIFSDAEVSAPLEGNSSERDAMLRGRWHAIRSVDTPLTIDCAEGGLSQKADRNGGGALPEWTQDLPVNTPVIQAPSDWTQDAGNFGMTEGQGGWTQVLPEYVPPIDERDWSAEPQLPVEQGTMTDERNAGEEPILFLPTIPSVGTLPHQWIAPSDGSHSAAPSQGVPPVQPPMRLACPELSCPYPPEGCSQGNPTVDAEGCAQCPELICTKERPVIGGPSLPPDTTNRPPVVQCPRATCSAPPAGCVYIYDRADANADGCPDAPCGALRCDMQRTPPVTPTTPTSFVGVQSSSRSSTPVISVASSSAVSSQTAVANAPTNSCEWKNPVSFQFSGDGALMAFSALSDEPVMGSRLEPQIFLHTVGSQTTRKLTDETGNSSAPMTGEAPLISRDGNFIAFVGRRARAGLGEKRAMRLDLQTNELRDIGFSGARPIDISDDGNHILLLQGSTCLYLYDAIADSTTVIAGIPALHNACISGAKNPVSQQPLNDRVFARQARIANGNVYFTATDCNPASTNCQWSINDTPTHSLYSYSIADQSAPVRTGEFNGYDIRVTHDGQMMKFAMIEPASGARRRIYQQPTNLASPATPMPETSVDGGLYFTGMSDDGGVFSFIGGSSQALNISVHGAVQTFPKNGNGPGSFGMSPDARYAALATPAQGQYAYQSSQRTMQKILISAMGAGAAFVVPRPGAQCGS